MSWPRDALAALKRIILLKERITSMTVEAKRLMGTCTDLDRRLLRLEAKFEVLERMATPAARRSLSDKSVK
jgi:hypothetical protein